MRRELHVILWVMVAALGLWVVYGGSSGVFAVASKLGIEDRSTVIGGSWRESRGSAVIWPIIIAEAASSAEVRRTLFPSVPAAGLIEVTAGGDGDPVLRGIVGDGADVWAVFSNSDGGLPYLTVGRGGAIGDFVVLEIGTDTVRLQRTTDGSIRVLELRGNGEQG